MREKELKIEFFKQNFLKSLTENDWVLYHTYLNLDEIKEVLRKELDCRFEEIDLVFDSKEEFPSEYYLTTNGKINVVWKLKVNFENTDGLSDKNVIKNIEVYELTINNIRNLKEIIQNSLTPINYFKMENQKNIVTLSYEIDNCIDCKFHKVIPDPDLNDSFCADDIAVICLNKRKEPNEIKSDSIYFIDRQEYKTITVGCRPYNKRKECNIPNWCPLLNSEK